MATTAVSHGLPFPLNVAPRILDGLEYPAAEHDSRGDWRLSYQVWTFTGRGGATGRLDIQRKAADAGGTVLTMRCTRVLQGGGSRVTDAQLHCRSDSLSTPERWQFTSESFDRNGKSVPHTRLGKSAVVQGNRVEISNGARRRGIAVAGAWTVNWALFEAVGRLPRQVFEPIRFTMFDHFDQVKANQTLSYRGSAAVVVGQRRVRKQRWVELQRGRIRKTTWQREGGREVRLHAYDHLGDGIVPWVYWVDEQGRLVLAISGLEGYILEDTKT